MAAKKTSRKDLHRYNPLKKSYNLQLIEALKTNNCKNLKHLIDKGADVNEPCDNLLPLIHVVEQRGHRKVAEFLKKNTKYKYTFLHLAVWMNHLECAKILLNNGATVSSKPEEFCDPIHIAVFEDYEGMTALLLDYGANINIRFTNNFFKLLNHEMLSDLWENHNLPLLHYSILKEFQSLTSLLLNYGADINLKTCLEKTTLMQAVEVNDYKLVKFLLSKDADANARDIFGQPVLHFTMINANRKASMYSKKEFKLANEKLETVETLVVSGEANINARFPEDQDHSSIIHYMIKYGFTEGISYLFGRNNFNWDDIDLRTIHSAKIKIDDLSPNIRNDLDYVITLESKFGTMISYIICSAISMKMIGLPIKEEIILKTPIHDWVSMDYYTAEYNNWINYMTRCIDYLKRTKIDDTDITLWYLLTCKMDKLVALMPHKRIKYWNQPGNHESKFLSDIIWRANETEWDSYYVDLVAKRLHNRLEYATIRIQYLRPATEVISQLFTNQLSYDCCWKIVKHLHNEDLYKL